MSAPILRTSERRAFKRCQASWWWAYREGLRPRGAEATPLWFGTGVHLAFAEWYIPGTKRGIHPAETWQKFAGDTIASVKVASATDERVAEYEDAVTLGTILMEEYVKYYGQDSSWDFIQAEQEFQLPIPWPKIEENRQSLYEADPGDILVQYHGRYDGVYRDLVDGKFKLLETKTARSVQTSHLGMDDQAGSYWAVAAMTLRDMGLIGPKEQLHGITYNFVRKGLPDERPRDAEGYFTNKPIKKDYQAILGIGDAEARKMKLEYLEGIAEKAGVTVLGERSKVQPPPLFLRETVWRTSKERNTQLRRIQDEAVQMLAVRDGSVSLTKNPDRHCSFCQFKAMCELQERQGDWQDFKRIAFRVEDPYKDYRKSAEES